MITDTTAEAEKRQHEIFERLSGEEKLRLAMALSDCVRDIAWAGFRRRHPWLSEETMRAMFLEDLHGIESPRRSKGQSG
jgi:hypothetical protein